MLSRARRSWGTALVGLLVLTACVSAQQPVDSPADPMPQWWARADYLLWNIEGSGTPPLVTTSPAGTPRGQAGVLNTPGVSVLVGNQYLNSELRHGLAFEAGWLGLGDPEAPLGFFASGFLLETAGDNVFTTSDGSTILARPFLNLNTNGQDARLIAFPGALQGTVVVATRSQLLGAEFNVMQQLYGCDGWRVGAYIGYRYLRFRDRLQVSDESISIDPLAVPGTRVSVTDVFDATTNFDGCNFGLDTRWQSDGLSLSLRTSIAVGYSREIVRIRGETTTQVPPDVARTRTGGLLALPTNSGTFPRSDAAILPQVGLTVGYALGESARVSVGYDFLYLSNAARAAAQIDPVINTTQLPPGTLTGLRRPFFNYQSSEVWAQGVRFGLEVTY